MIPSFHFSGNGSAFHHTRGNNNAYFKVGRTLYLLDCGGAAFHRMLAMGIFEGIERVVVLITHTHGDHVGGLSDLVLYTFFDMAPSYTKKIEIYTPVFESVRSILTLMGAEDFQYVLFDMKEKTKVDFFDVTPFEVKHVKPLTCFAFLFEDEESRVYFSGDSNMIPEEILSMFLNGEIDLFYQDVCMADYPGNVHLHLSLLEKAIPVHLRHKVICMHLDKTLQEAEVLEKGFQVAIV